MIATTIQNNQQTFEWLQQQPYEMIDKQLYGCNNHTTINKQSHGCNNHMK